MLIIFDSGGVFCYMGCIKEALIVRGYTTWVVLVLHPPSGFVTVKNIVYQSISRKMCHGKIIAPNPRRLRDSSREGDPFQVFLSEAHYMAFSMKSA